MAGRNLLRKTMSSLDSQAGRAGLSPGERNLSGEKDPEVEMSGNPPQRRNAARETALRLTARQPLSFDGVQGAQATARQGGASGTEAVSLSLTLRHGMETRCPGGVGQRRRSWLCAKYDSPPGRP